MRLQIKKSGNKSKAFWEVFNKERTTKTKRNNQFILIIDGKLTKKSAKDANYLKFFFVNIAEVILKDNTSKPTITSQHNSSENNQLSFSSQQHERGSRHN